MRETDDESEDSDQWLVKTLIAIEHPEVDARRRELAAQLGVDVGPLERLRVGWLSNHWVMPERDATGHVIGINCRFQNGTKRQLTGSSRGLTYADDWLSADGPVFLVEGCSDTAAAMTAGCCVIGRPSNVGGVAMLAVLLRGHADRELFVIGENDRKLHSGLSDKNQAKHEPQCEGCSRCWPGLHGARATARQLAERLNRPVTVMMPRVEKDIRQILQRSRAAEEVV